MHSWYMHAFLHYSRQRRRSHMHTAPDTATGAPNLQYQIETLVMVGPWEFSHQPASRRGECWRQEPVNHRSRSTGARMRSFVRRAGVCPVSVLSYSGDRAMGRVASPSLDLDTPRKNNIVICSLGLTSSPKGPNMCAMPCPSSTQVADAWGGEPK